MLAHMLGTSLCIRLLRDRPQGLRARFNAEADTLRLSTITLTELLRGAAKSARETENRRQVEGLAGRLGVLSFNADAAAHAGDIHADLERRGRLIGSHDILIAGHARSRGLVVVTADLDHFGRVDGLRCEDWLPPG